MLVEMYYQVSCSDVGSVRFFVAVVSTMRNHSLDLWGIMPALLNYVSGAISKIITERLSKEKPKKKT